MCDCMRFPDTVEEFMEQYKVVDKEGIYMSKGAELIPIFRMEQWFEHEKAQKKGHWIDEGTNYLCSECHRGCWVNSDYCPWCGADMTGDEDG